MKTRLCSTTTHSQTLLLCYHENQISHRQTKNVLHTPHNYTIKGKHVATRDDFCGWLFAPGHGAFDHYERLGPLPNFLRCSALVVGVAKLKLFQQKHPIARKPGSTMGQLSLHGGGGAGCGFVERCV